MQKSRPLHPPKAPAGAEPPHPQKPLKEPAGAEPPHPQKPLKEPKDDDFKDLIDGRGKSPTYNKFAQFYEVN